MLPYGYQSNLEMEVLSASPLELIRMLYDGAIQSLQQAVQHLAAGDIKRRSREIERTILILHELSTSLNRSAGGEIAGQLVEIYDYMQRRLHEANQKQDAAPLEEVQNLLRTLREGWVEVISLTGSASFTGSLAALTTRIGESVRYHAGEPQTSLCG